jgi:hypothetical protein
MTTHLGVSVSTCQADPVLDQLIEEFTNKLQAGEPVDVSDYLCRYPEYAETLRQALSALEVLGALGRSLAAVSGRAITHDEHAGAGTGVLGDYQIIREVGRGGMGVVYEAKQVSLGRRVALKVLPFAAAMDPRHLQRFQLEAQAAAHLQHGNIVPVFAVGSDRGVHFYAMQFIEGRSLAEVIQSPLRGRKGAHRAPERFAQGQRPSRSQSVDRHGWRAQGTGVRGKRRKNGRRAGHIRGRHGRGDGRAGSEQCQEAARLQRLDHEPAAHSRPRPRMLCVMRHSLASARNRPGIPRRQGARPDVCNIYILVYIVYKI